MARVRWCNPREDPLLKARKRWAARSSSVYEHQAKIGGSSFVEKQKEAEKERKASMIFNAEKFRAEIYNPLYERTDGSSRKMDGIHKGLANSASELADGYAQGKTGEEVKAELNARRIRCQMDFYPFSVEMREKVEAFLGDTFKLDPLSIDSLSRLLSTVDLSERELKALARENEGNYTALRAIAKNARDRELGFGSVMASRLETFRSEVERQARGLVDTCCKGVLEKGYHESWRTVAAMRMDGLEAAHSNLMEGIGAAESVDPMVQAMQEYAWRN